MHQPATVSLAAGREEQFGPYYLRNARPDDAGGIVDLFRRCFERSVCQFQPRTEALLRWKYGAPTGSLSPGATSCVAVHEESGEIVAHVGGMALVMRCRGERRLTVQCADHMVAPEHRRLPAGSSLFARLMHVWIDNVCGLDAAFLAWGFPSRRDYRIGARQLGYRPLGSVRVLVRAVERRDGGARGPSELVPELPDDVGRLWEEVASGVSFGVERSLEYLRWRYADAARIGYRFVSLPGRGFAVVRAAALDEGVAHVLEWIVADDDREGAAQLLEGVERAVRELGCDCLSVWAPAGSSSEWFSNQGATAHELSLRPTARSWDPAVPIEELAATARFSLGDIDYL